NWGSRQTIDRKIVFPFPLLEVSIPEEESRAARVTERQLRAAGALDLLDDTYPRDNPYGFRMAIREAAPEVDLLAEERVPSAVLDWFDGDVAMDGASSEPVEALARESVRWARDAQSAVLDLLRTAPLPPETRAAVEPLVLDYLSRYSADHPRPHDFSDLFPRARRWMGGDPAVNFTDHRVRGKLGLSDDDVFIDTLKALLVFREAAHQLGAGANARRPLAERLDVLHRQYLRLRLARALLARPGLTIPAEASFIARTIDEAFARVRESIDWTDRSMDYVDVPALLESERSILEEETAGGYVAVRLRVAPDVEKLGKVFAYDGLLLTGLRHFVQEAIEVASRRAPAEVEWVTVQLSMTRANEIRVGVRTTFKREGSWTVDNRFQSALDSVGGDWGPRTGDPNREAWFTLPVLNAPVPNLSWKNRLVIVLGGLAGTRKEAVARSLASRLGLRYLRAGFLMRIVLYELLTRYRGTDLSNNERVARYARSILAEVDLTQEPVRVRGVSTAEPDAEGDTYRDRVRALIDRSPENTLLLDRLAGLPGVQESLVEKINATLRVARSQNSYNGVVLVVTRPALKSGGDPAVVPFFLHAEDALRAQRTGVDPRRLTERDRASGVVGLEGEFLPAARVDANRSVREVVKDISDRLQGAYQTEAGFYREFVETHGLKGGVGADIATSSHFEPALGLRAGGLSTVYAVDFLNGAPKQIEEGVWSINGDATRLSATPEFGREKLDLLVYNDSLQYIVDPHYWHNAAYVRENPGAWDGDDGFSLVQDLLDQSMKEAWATLRPGGRILITWTAVRPSPSGRVAPLAGRDVRELLAFAGFTDIEPRELAPGRFVVTAVKPHPPSVGRVQSLFNAALTGLRTRGPNGRKLYLFLTVAVVPWLEELVFRQWVFGDASLLPLFQWFVAVPVFVLAHRILHRESWVETFSRILPAVLFSAAFLAAPGQGYNVLLHALWNAAVLALGRGPLMSVAGGAPTPLYDFYHRVFHRRPLRDVFDQAARRVGVRAFVLDGDWPDERGAPPRVE
ncbi:MAG TPA: hypothetical protein PKZ00_03845, partial [Elusimicrobiota bacterium]|nr:hypothetical protein [Elusimicrobiota bacterium]